jgi:hypothetical protein
MSISLTAQNFVDFKMLLYRMVLSLRDRSRKPRPNGVPLYGGSRGVLPPDSSQSRRGARSSGSFVDFRGGRAVAFLISPLMCEKWAFRYFWPILPALCVIPNREERRFQATKRDVAKALLLFRRTIAALKQAGATGEDGVAVVDREVGLEATGRHLADHRRGRRRRRSEHPGHCGRALFRAAPGQSAFPGGVPLLVEHAARPDPGGDRSPEGDGSQWCPRARRPSA